MGKSTKSARVSLGYGRGAVERLTSGSYRWQGTIDGQRVSITRPTQGEAIAAADAALDAGTKSATGQTVAEAVAGWRSVADRGRSASTVAVYGWATDVIVGEVGHVPVAELTRAQLRLVLADWTEHYGAETIAKLRSVLGRVLDYAVDAAWIDASPMPPRTPGSPKPRRRTAHLSPADMATVRRYLVAEHTTTHALFLAMLLTGMRPGEARALQWDAVDFDAGRLDVRRTVERGRSKAADRLVDGVKTSRHGDEGERTLPMPPDLIAVLRRERDAQRARAQVTPFVFADDRGRFLSSYVVEHGATAIARETGTRLVTPNGYRHTFLSMLADSGLPSATRKRLAGHKAGSTVLEEHYTHDMRGDDVDTTPYLGSVVTL